VSRELSAADQGFLKYAIDLSRRALEDDGKTPFGAIVVVANEIVSEGTSSVIELRDPTAHAEVMALRNAGVNLGRHLFEDAIMYASSFRRNKQRCRHLWIRGSTALPRAYLQGRVSIAARR
jgi:tRNA(Arg) A34 adenosine deaminase TadA